MSEEEKINSLVSQGKKEVLMFVLKSIASSALIHVEDGAADATSQFFQSLQKEGKEIGVPHVRKLLMEENEAVFAKFLLDSEIMLPVFARAVGRLMQLKECMAATERLCATHADSADFMQERLWSLRSTLAKAERELVKIGIDGQGNPVLRELAIPGAKNDLFLTVQQDAVLYPVNENFPTNLH